MATGHGKDKSSGEQSVISVSTEELEDIMTGFAIAESNEGQSPEVVLKRMLSMKTAISTSSSHAERMRRAQEQTALQNFTHIGSGQCGDVFQQSGTVNVIKRAKSENMALQLWNDYVTHWNVQKAFAKRADLAIDMRVPRPLYFVSKDDQEWWTHNECKFPAEVGNKPKSVLVAERILPLHKDIRSSLIRKYCPAKYRDRALEHPGNADCLMRVYLGSERPEERKSMLQGFSLRNFKLYLDDMDQLELDSSTYATTMAQALAVMHWDVKCDARDVEFVLGSAPSTEDEIPEFTKEEFDKLAPFTSTRLVRLNFKRRTVHLWILDFNQVKNISMDDAGIQSAVRAFVSNDPYFPRPFSQHSKGQKLWSTFRSAYLQTSDLIMRLQEAKGEAVTWSRLPEAFIEKLVGSEQERLVKKAAALERIAEWDEDDYGE